MACSIGSMTDEDISSGLAPGMDKATLTVAGSAFGNRSTPSPWNDTVPSTTSDITSIVANTGRRTQSSDNTWGLPENEVRLTFAAPAAPAATAAKEAGRHDTCVTCRR